MPGLGLYRARRTTRAALEARVRRHQERERARRLASWERMKTAAAKRVGA